MPLRRRNKQRAPLGLIYGTSELFHRCIRYVDGDGSKHSHANERDSRRHITVDYYAIRGGVEARMGASTHLYHKGTNFTKMAEFLVDLKRRGEL